MSMKHVKGDILTTPTQNEDMLEYDVSTDKWHRVEEECIELV